MSDISLKKAMEELYKVYPFKIEEMISLLRNKKNNDGVIGSNIDETLVRVYKKVGYDEALNDVINFFRI